MINTAIARHYHLRYTGAAAGVLQLRADLDPSPFGHAAAWGDSMTFVVGNGNHKFSPTLRIIGIVVYREIPQAPSNFPNHSITTYLVDPPIASTCYCSCCFLHPFNSRRTCAHVLKFITWSFRVLIEDIGSTPHLKALTTSSYIPRVGRF